MTNDLALDRKDSYLLARFRENCMYLYDPEDRMLQLSVWPLSDLFSVCGYAPRPRLVEIEKWQVVVIRGVTYWVYMIGRKGSVKMNLD